MELVQRKLEYLGTLFDSDEWSNCGHQNDILSESLAVKKARINCFRSSTAIRTDVQTLVDYVWDTYNSLEEMKDDDIVEYEIIENIDSDTRICRQVNKLPWPLWPRESVYFQHRFQKDEIVYILMFSVLDDRVPLNNDKYVRSTILVSGYVFIPQKNSTMIYRIAHVDPVGNIPASIVNSTATKTSTVLRRLQKVFH